MKPVSFCWRCAWMLFSYLTSEPRDWWRMKELFVQVPFRSALCSVGLSLLIMRGSEILKCVSFWDWRRIPQHLSLLACFPGAVGESRALSVLSAMPLPFQALLTLEEHPGYSGLVRKYPLSLASDQTRSLERNVASRGFLQFMITSLSLNLSLTS